MTMQSYEAIYEHGQLKWLGDKPETRKARVIVTIVSIEADDKIPKRHRPSAKIAGKGKVLGDIIAPASPPDEWEEASEPPLEGAEAARTAFREKFGYEDVHGMEDILRHLKGKPS